MATVADAKMYGKPQSLQNVMEYWDMQNPFCIILVGLSSLYRSISEIVRVYT